MRGEIELISDGDGVLVLGDPGDVDRFLRSEGFASEESGGPSVAGLLGQAGAALGAASGIAAQSGRWVQLTEESAAKVARYGLSRSAATGCSTGVMRASGGQVAGFVEFVARPASVLANPAVLAGAAGLLTQLAVQKSIDDLGDYLAVIDAKVDDILRGQKDAVLAELVGVGFVVDEAMTIRGEVGHVSEVTWSKVQAASLPIAGAQAYALRRLDALATRVEGTSSIRDQAKAARQNEAEAREWLAVLARCVQLHDSLTVLELDRLRESEPDEVERHRVGVRAARAERLGLIVRSTSRVVEAMHAAADRGNEAVLLHPTASPALVSASHRVAENVGELHRRLGRVSWTEELAARPWWDAATELADSVRDTGAQGWQNARDAGSQGWRGARDAGRRANRHARGAVGGLAAKVRQGAGRATRAGADSVGEHGDSSG